MGDRHTDRSRSHAVLVVVTLLLVPAMAGCAQFLPTDDGNATDDGDDGGDGSDGGDGDDGPPPVTLDVTLVDPPSEVGTGDAINVSWRVNVSTDAETEIPHTAVHYANTSVSDPQAPSDYGNTSDDDGSANGATVPATFNTSFTIDAQATIYLRAHAIHNGTNYWSDETQVAVKAPESTIHTVGIGNTTPSGPLSEYDPDPVTIEPGDGVKWTNLDPTGINHTATNDSGEFDTGQIAADETSDVIFFDDPGTYDYICSNHEGTMSGQVVVEES